MLGALLQQFEVQAPVATMVRAKMANVLAPAQLDEIFRDTAVHQREGELLFSSVVGLLHLAVLKTKPSLHAAYQTQHEELGVSVKSVYEKLAHVELPVTRMAQSFDVSTWFQTSYRRRRASLVGRDGAAS